MNKIDLIIDALETSKPINQESSIPFDKHLKALAAARELRELKPVVYLGKTGLLFNNTTHLHLHTAIYELGLHTALYALDEVK